ncbi:MAG: TIGR03032 family protein [Cycloclasticus sp.]|nr:TIGR03032 family protein [Cycloclasticus sp.]
MSNKDAQKEQNKTADAATNAQAYAAEEKAANNKVEYSVSGGLLAKLQKLNISIAFTSYQSGLLYFIGRNVEGGINVHQTGLPKPMGLCMDKKGSLTMTGGYQIMRFENILEANQQINNTFDTCFVPRRVHVTGHLDAHDVGINNDGQPVFINTRFNCIATVAERHSFVELWRPPFISALVDEDRCHLNGMAMQDGEPRYVTAVSKSNTIDGWRDRRGDGGVVIDVKTNKIVCEGLSMPHSPRMYDGKLWLLNSGTGELGVVNIDDDGAGQFEPKVFCPGFTRGLAFYGNFAFVGLSKPRYKRFEGLALDEKLKQADSEAWCGVQIIDLSTNSCVDWFRIDGNVTELFDLEVIPDSACPMAVPAESPEAAELVTFAPSTLN